MRDLRADLHCAFYETARLPSACTPLPVSEAPSAGPLKNIYAPALIPFWSPPPGRLRDVSLKCLIILPEISVCMSYIR